ncbi:MAG: hypothetical protein WDA11_00865 [Thiohalomonadaceae bacterium]
MQKAQTKTTEQSTSAASDCYGSALPEDRLKEEWERLRSKLGDTWTAAESSTYFGFFCHGWYGRVNTAAYQYEP